MRELDVSILLEMDKTAVTFDCREDVVDFIYAVREQLDEVEHHDWDEKEADYMLDHYKHQNRNLALSIGSEKYYGLEWCYDEWFRENGYNVIHIDELRASYDEFEIEEDLSTLLV